MTQRRTWKFLLLSAVLLLTLVSVAAADGTVVGLFGYVRDADGDPIHADVKVQCYQADPEWVTTPTVDPGPAGYWQVVWESDEGDTVPPKNSWCRFQALRFEYPMTPTYCSRVQWVRVIIPPGELLGTGIVYLDRPYSVPTNCAMWK